MLILNPDIVIEEPFSRYVNLNWSLRSNIWYKNTYNKTIMVCSLSPDLHNRDVCFTRDDGLTSGNFDYNYICGCSLVVSKDRYWKLWTSYSTNYINGPWEIRNSWNGKANAITAFILY